MVDDSFIYSLSLSVLPIKTRKLLSRLLNSPKVIPSDGPDKLPRDWRGLASLINISTQDELYIQQYPDKVAKLLEIWLERSTSPSVGELLNFLCHIDRYDVYDDVSEDLRSAVTIGEIKPIRQNLAIERYNNNNNNVLVPLQDGEDDPITYDDRPGQVLMYDAVVLYANEDRDFVDLIIHRMSQEGFRICTVDDLQAGHTTQYKPMAQLISSRCLRIMLIFSPDFLTSKGMAFYTDFAQADSIESKSSRKILPILYRDCLLPRHLSFYHKLYYHSKGRPMYDFWEKLTQSLILARPQGAAPQGPMLRGPMLRGPMPPAIRQAPVIIPLSQIDSKEPTTLIDPMDPSLFDDMTSNSKRSVSMSGLDTLTISTDCESLSSSVCQVNEKRTKKKSTLSKIINTFTRKRKKNKAVDSITAFS
ncbi:myeloid differentiation primary response protein MyD88-like [Anticarsia gemmatalis]|uniref:myeloid differentiation primary response protein MyD88-like n=1 Tax=Anticarsia gemmatalis TaxID=129554 RepID=UPI003F7736C7